MARIDKLLATIHSKSGKAIRMDPGQQPTLEVGSGARLPLLAEPTPAGMIELLAMEVLPPALRDEFLMGGEVSFDHEAGGQTFRITCSRSSAGIHILAEPAAPAPVPTGEPPLIALDTDRSPGAPRLAPAPSPAPLPEPRREPASGSHGGGAASTGLAAAERLFAAMLELKASDIHCSSFEVPIFRIHGDMEEMADFGLLGPSQLQEMMQAIAPPVAWHTFQETNDADFAYGYDAGNCRFRVNFFMDKAGPGFVCRQIPNEIPDPDRLGLAEPIRRLCNLSKGLVLVTGPTGSGKSTTLAAIIDLANQKRSDHIITIEDPIEFVHPRKKCLVNQREVGTHTESFKKALRAALREDPDIVLVGEMRDLETIAIALETAITGHLVFGTLHTSSAIGTIDRIVDQFPADRQQQIRVMLADSLKAVISQALLKRRGGGRIAAMESLFITPAIANLIREGKNFQIPSAMQTGRAYGQKLMNDALIELIVSQQVEPMEAYMKCPDKESFMQAIKRASINFEPREGKFGE
ncbi:MAG: PilT/PilU family type 4a pilus ATPase [Acidobacteria bacterium]|nr:PilT/PilU family type 4a pilus ATPase [Acidobacteriota bacterium]